MCQLSHQHVTSEHLPRTTLDSRPRLSGGARLRCGLPLLIKSVELRSTGQPRAAVPTWFVVVGEAPAAPRTSEGARAYTSRRL
jgi:hypothetical protein